MSPVHIFHFVNDQPQNDAEKPGNKKHMGDNRKCYDMHITHFFFSGMQHKQTCCSLCFASMFIEYLLS